MVMHGGYDACTAELVQRSVEMYYAAANLKLSYPRFVDSDVEEVLLFIGDVASFFTDF